MLFRPITLSIGSIVSVVLLFLGTVFYFDRKIDHVLREHGLQADTTTGDRIVNGSFAAFGNENSTILSEKEPSTNDLIANSTLGFEKILGLSLPERTDRRDMLSLVGTFFDIKIDWMDAVKGEDINKKAWPAHWNTRTNLSLGELGCWRSHLNAVQRVVQDGLSTALIIEDDADWDVNIKSQLQGLSKAVEALGSPDGQSAPSSPSGAATNPGPYGDNWDLLWLGTCLTPQGPSEVQTFPGQGSEWPNLVHMVFRAHGGLGCTFGYALNRRSAISLLGWLLDVDDTTDFTISKWCEHHDCITVWPHLIGSHGYVGRKGRDSDIWHSAEPKEKELARVEAGDEVREQGETWNIAHSAILEVMEKVGNKGLGNG